MADTLINLRPRSDIPAELKDLIARCYREKPEKKDLDELRRHLDANPQLWRDVADLGHITRVVLIDQLNLNQPAAVAGVLSSVDGLRAEMGYQAAPMLERLLIDNIINTWIYLQWAELQHSKTMSAGGTYEAGEYWNKILTGAQKRHIRACEALARVRKMALPAIQVNVNAPDGRQVNIAGDLVKP